MFKYLFILLFIFQGCSVSPNKMITNTDLLIGELNCEALTNMYYKYTFLKNKKLVIPKEYEVAFKRSFLKEQTLLFSQALENTNSVSFKYINKICFDLSSILKEQNFKKKQNRLFKFKKKLMASYKKNLKKIKFQFKYVVGCKKYASSYVNSLIGMTTETYNHDTVEKRHYKQCIEYTK